ncbi:MAG TPA: threonine synthase, partial [Bacteroidetes bacterium]|nr:threonine synthase [Bacteroidota bacterium]
ALSISDKETKETIKNVYNRYKTILEPHGAVAWKGLTDSVGTDLTDDKLMVSLETAHPFKFKEEIIKLLGLAPDIPMSLKGLDNKPEYLTNMENDYQALKDFIVKN